jgi:hypothetical protein
VEAICAEAKVEDPSIRASDIIDRGFVGCPALESHVWVRVARVWWYTESTRDGRRVELDLFDDALPNYLTELDVLITQDHNLTAFGETAFPDKRFLSPDRFLAECLNGA